MKVGSDGAGSGAGSNGGGGSKKDGEHIMVMDDSANVGDVVKAMNRLGVTPKDLITILQSIKAAGALHGDLEIL